MPNQMTATEFAASIKAKYPAYASVPDDQLVAKMLEKYPVYRDKIAATQAPDQQPQSTEQPGGLRWRPEHAALGAQIDNAPMMAEPLMPNVIRGAKAVKAAIPSATRAGQKFERVMGAAKDVPIDISGPGNVALRIQQLAERGGSMPKAVRDFLKRSTDPTKGDITYQEARDFASNISRLSANEFGRLTPVVANEVHKLRIALNKAVENAARQVGKGDDYLAAMKEYARAAKVRKAWEGTKKAAVRYAVPAGVGYWAFSKASGTLRDFLGLD